MLEHTSFVIRACNTTLTRQIDTSV